MSAHLDELIAELEYTSFNLNLESITEPLVAEVRRLQALVAAAEAEADSLRRKVNRPCENPFCERDECRQYMYCRLDTYIPFPEVD